MKKLFLVEMQCGRRLHVFYDNMGNLVELFSKNNIKYRRIQYLCDTDHIIDLDKSDGIEYLKLFPEVW